MAEASNNPAALKLSDGELVAKVTALYNSALAGGQDWRDRAERCRDFHAGHQWDPADRAALHAAGKPALTINRILGIVGFVSGNQRQNSKDIRVRPLRNGTEAAANALTALAKHAMSTCNGTFEQSEQFERGVITGKGWLMADIENDPFDANGRRVVVRSVDPLTVFEDATFNDYELTNAKSVIREYYEDRDKIAAKWPSLELDAISDVVGSADQGWLGKMIDRLFSRAEGRPEPQGETRAIWGDDCRATERNRNRLRVLECWWKDWRKVAVSTDRAQGSVIVCLSEKDRKGAEIAAQLWPDRWGYSEQVMGVLNRTVIIGSSLAEHVVDPLGGVHEYPFFRFCPFFSDGYVWGLVDNLTDPQREENTRRSQALHLLGQSANSGWIIKKFMDPAYKAILEQFGSKPGIIIELDKLGGEAQRIAPTPLSEGHIQLGQAAADDMKQISGVANMMGQDSQTKESGLALGLRQRQGMSILEGAYDRFDYACQLFGTFLVELIRRDGEGKPVYSDQEIDRICDLDSCLDEELIQQAATMIPQPPAPAQSDPNAPADPVDQQAHDQYRQAVVAAAKQILLRQIRDVATGRYSVEVSQSPQSPTARTTAFAELTEIDRMRPGVIPAKLLVKATDVPFRDEIIDSIDRNEQAQAQQAQMLLQKEQQAPAKMGISAKV